MSREGEFGLDDVLEKATSIGLPETIRNDIARCSAFHSYPAPGLVIGVFMVDRALRELEARPGEKLFAVAETRKCLPDALQVCAGCTIGNNRLRVLEAGRFAIAVNRPTLGDRVEGLRVFLDENRLRDLPVFYAWFTHDPSYHRHTLTSALFDEILGNADNYVASERVAIKVTQKKGWESGRCVCCGELVPDTLLREGTCIVCRDTSYYERISPGVP
jgi:formylmethanofuran dehydrogenase subunit E